MKKQSIIYCADVIARLGVPTGPFVIVERLGSVKGLALPGGKQEMGESLSSTVMREFEEETGLSLILSETLLTTAENARDPRGYYVSTVFRGIASGTPRNEEGKTHVLLLSVEEIIQRREEFVFDHFEIIAQILDIGDTNESLKERT